MRDYACYIRGNTEMSTARHASSIKSDSFCMDAKMYFFECINVLRVFVEGKMSKQMHLNI